MTLYEVNKQGYGQLPAMTQEQEKDASKRMTDFLSSHDSTYILMLGKDQSYYTMFVYCEGTGYYRMADEILNVAKSLGTLKSVEITEQMIEIWVDDRLYGVMPWDFGVIEV